MVSTTAFCMEFGMKMEDGSGMLKPIADYLARKYMRGEGVRMVTVIVAGSCPGPIWAGRIAKEMLS